MQRDTITSKTNLQVALDCAAVGFRVMPLRWKEELLKDGKTKRKEKSPVWTDYMEKATSDAATIRRVWTGDPKLLVGILCDRFDVVDLDRHKDRDGFASLKSKGVTLNTPLRAKTAGNGEHHFFAPTPDCLSANGVLDGVDIKARYRNGTASYIVAPGTVAPWGRYEWLDGDLTLLADVIDLGALPPVPEALWHSKGALEPASVQASVDQSGIPEAVAYARRMMERAKRILRDAADRGEPRTPALFDQAVHLGTLVACCTLTGEEATTALMEAADGAGLSAEYSEGDLLRQIGNGLAAGMRHPKPWVSPAEEAAADFPDVISPEEEAEIAALVIATPVPVLPEDRWGTPMMTPAGKPILNQYNATLYLGRNVDSILPGLSHNLMSHRDEWRGGEVTDADIVQTRTALNLKGLDTVPKELVQDAVLAVARYQKYHPIRDALDRVKHDGRPRLDDWLIRYAGVADTSYARAVGRKFLIQMVARVMEPGCKADHTLVLIGPQRAGKSSLCGILAGAQYHSDTLPAISGGKDVMEHLQGIWVVELSELAPARKSDAEDLKAFLTTQVDRFRVAYGKRTQSFPRQCVFIGTTNDDEFLRDPTGGRRFWPVHVAVQIDLEGLAADRDQLLAEAMAAYQAGETWWLAPEFEEAHAKPIQEAARVKDSWTETIAAWLDRAVTDELDGSTKARDEVTLGEVMADALGIASGQQSQPMQTRAAAVLRTLGWVKVHTKRGNVWRRATE